MPDNPFAPPRAALHESGRVRRWPQYAIAIAGVCIAAIPGFVSEPVVYVLDLLESRPRMFDFRGLEAWFYVSIAFFVATIALAALSWRGRAGGTRPFVLAALAQVLAVATNIFLILHPF